MLPGLRSNPDAIRHLIHERTVANLFAKKLIGQQTFGKVGQIAQLLESRIDPEREKAYKRALHEAGLDLDELALSCIRNSHAGTEWNEEKLAPDLDTDDLLSRIDQDKVAAIRSEFTDLDEESDWSIEELRNSPRMTDIRTLSIHCLQLLNVVRRKPNLSWLRIGESVEDSMNYEDDEEIQPTTKVSYSGAFTTTYRELMLRKVKVV